MKHCAHCEKPLDNNRRKFCSEHCQYRFNSIKRDNEKGLAPARKRTANYFSMITGYEIAGSKGQGKRSGTMVKGSMSARISCTVEQWAELTTENLIRHFTSIKHFTPTYVLLGNGERISATQIKTLFNLNI